MKVNKNLRIWFGALVVIALIFPSPAKAQFSKTPWEMNLGEGIVSFGYQAPYHGYEGEYDFATIPADSDPGWELAPNPDIIDYSQIPSTLCGVMGCRWGGDFTYFRTYVNIPSGSTVTEFTISMSGVDDGVRVTIFNSTYPTGIVVPGSYVFLGGSGTANLQSLVAIGEINMVILTQVDDCCYHSYLNIVNVVINGTIVPRGIEVDIKPGSYPSSINLSKKGVTPVAIHTTDDFDATTVDPASVRLNDCGPPVNWEAYDCDEIPNPLYGEPDEPEMIGDGDIDLVLYFDTPELADGGCLEVGDTEATLTGETFDGVPIEGTGDVRNLVKGPKS